MTLDGSHPYAILARLASEAIGVEKSMLALCLEARDDSEAEFQRVLGLARIDDVKKVRAQIGATPFGFQNALKILPSLAVQLGDAKLDRSSRIVAASSLRPSPAPPSPGISAVPTVPAPTGPVTRPATPPASGGQPVPPSPGTTQPPSRSHRTVDARSIAVSRPSDEVPEENISDLTEAIRLRTERARRHNEIVRKWAGLAAGCGHSLQEDPYDCLSTAPDGSSAILAEVKALVEPADRADEREQVRAALGQLLYYEEMDLPSNDKPTSKVGVFGHRPSNEHIQFLNRHGIGVVWLEGDRFRGDDRTMGDKAIRTVLDQQQSRPRPRTLETDW